MPKTMNEQDLELYEAYLDNSLDVEAKTDFEVRLKTDETFKTNFEGYKNATFFLSEKFGGQEEQIAFEQNLENISNAHFDKKPVTSVRTEIWKYAAAIVLLVSVGGYFLMDKGHPQYADFATNPSIALVQRSSGDELSKKAEDAFNNKHFDEATVYFNELLKEDANNQELLLYRGIARIETDSYSAAYTDLDRVAKGASVYKNEALWYKALALLKQEKYDACKMVLVEIPATADEYEKAQKLLDEL